MQAAISARSWLRNARRPVNLGWGGEYDDQSTGVLLARACASVTSGVFLRPACCVRTRS